MLSSGLAEEELTVVFIAQPSLHTAGLLAEHFLKTRVPVDIIAISGAFNISNVDHEPATQVEFEGNYSHYPTNESNIPGYVTEGSITSIIGQLESMGRVVYLPGSTRDKSAHDADEHQPHLTAHSTNLSCNLVEIAPTLFISGLEAPVNDDAIAAFFEMTTEVLAQHCSDSDPEPALIVVSNASPALLGTRPEVLLSVGAEPEAQSHITPDEVSASEAIAVTQECGVSREHKLKPLYSTGHFVVTGVRVSTDSENSTGTWEIARASEGFLDVKRHAQLPLDLAW